MALLFHHLSLPLYLPFVLSLFYHRVYHFFDHGALYVEGFKWRYCFTRGMVRTEKYFQNLIFFNYVDGPGGGDDVIVSVFTQRNFFEVLLNQTEIRLYM